jgi:aminocarboxymuconate-semialdehyde decarboxylase
MRRGPTWTKRPRRDQETPMPPIIDFHAHLIPPRLVETLVAHGADYGVHVSGPAEAPQIRLENSGWTKPIPLPLTRVAERIATLDRQGIDKQVMAPWIDFSGYTMPTELGIRFSELQNETIADVAAAHPDRLMGAATVPMQSPDDAARVLRDAVHTLGFRSVQIATYFGGKRFLDDPALDPFWRVAEEMQVLVYFHPYDEQPPNGTADYFMHNIVNYPLQTAIAIPRMIFGGVFQRFPRMRVCFPHGGGYLPYQFGRIRRAAAVRPEPKVHGYAGDPLDQLKTFYFDTIVHNPASLRFLADMVGADRLVMGSDYPFDMNDADPVASVRAGIDPEWQDSVLGGLAQRLLGLDTVAAA